VDIGWEGEFWGEPFLRNRTSFFATINEEIEDVIT